MLMSKHHYAIELGKAGNKIYFINHPDRRKELERGEIRIESTDSENVWSVSHRLLLPYFLKFQTAWLYNCFVAMHIRKIVRAIGITPDIIWSFDTGNTLPSRYFSKNSLKIFMPVDGPFGHIHERRSVDDADIIVSVSDRILNAFNYAEKPKLLVNHGVAEVFFSPHQEPEIKGKIRIGYSGSLLRSDFDFEAIIDIIGANQDKVFEFWGEYDIYRSNIHFPQDVGEISIRFINSLKAFPNVILHGPVSPAQLAAGLNEMDLFLICYVEDRQNSHKILEYFGTGKVVVSSHLSTYENADPDLLIMVKDPTSNREFPALFVEAVNNLDRYNSPDKQEKRKQYAQHFSYRNNIRRIENFVSRTLKQSVAF